MNRPNPLRLWRETRAESTLETLLILGVAVVPFAGLSLFAVRVTAGYLDLLVTALAAPWP
jgi:hypothetical protein